MTGDPWLEAQRRMWDSWLRSGPATGAQAPGFSELSGLSSFGALLKQVIEALPAKADRAAFEDAWKSHADAAHRVLAGPLGQFGGMPANLAALAGDWLRQAPASAAVGYTREWQERLQRIERAIVGLAQSQAKLQAIHKEIAASAWEALGRRVAGALEGSQSPGLREIYDAWIDSAEDAYRRRVMHADYAREYGESLNRLFALKGEVGRLIDSWLRLFNLPTRRELDAIHQRLRVGSSRAGRRAMDDQVAALKRQVDELANIWLTMQQHLSDLRQTAAAEARPAPAAPAEAPSVKVSAQRRLQPRRKRSPRPKAPPAAQEWDIGNL